MVQYDDTASDEPVRIYDRGMDMLPPTPTNFGEHQLIYRTGDVVIPRIEPREPLRLELEDFAHAIRTGEEPRLSLALGIQIVATVELAEASMRAGAKPLALVQAARPGGSLMPEGWPLHRSQSALDAGGRGSRRLRGAGSGLTVSPPA